ARLAQGLPQARDLHLVLHHVEHALRARLDAVRDLPAAGAAHEPEVLGVEQVRVAVAAPGEAEALGEEALAELDDAPPAHREEIVVEEDVAHPEPLETPAHLHHVLDAVEAPAPARRGAVAEGAREGAAARRHHARHRRGAVVEDVRLEPEREVRHQVPRRLGQPIESLAVEILGARVGMHALAVAPDEARDGARIAARAQLRVRALALADHAVVAAREHGQRRLGHRAPGRAGGPSTRRAARRRPRSGAAWRAYSGTGGGGEGTVAACPSRPVTRSHETREADCRTEATAPHPAATLPSPRRGEGARPMA